MVRHSKNLVSDLGCSKVQHWKNLVPGMDYQTAHYLGSAYQTVPGLDYQMVRYLGSVHQTVRYLR